jgi:DNA-binding MarR family transcriptional regulator
MKLIQEKPYHILEALKPKLGQKWVDGPDAQSHADTTDSHFIKTANKLVEKGLVEKRKKPSSQRTNQYKLTEEGLKVLGNLEDVKEVV